MANVNRATVKNIKSGVTRKNMFRLPLAEHKAEVEVYVPMTMEPIIPNATVPIIMNGVLLKRNAFVQLPSNILVWEPAMREEKEILVIINIQNVNAQAVLHGMLHKELVFVPELIFVR